MKKQKQLKSCKVIIVYYFTNCKKIDKIVIFI